MELCDKPGGRPEVVAAVIQRPAPVGARENVRRNCIIRSGFRTKQYYVAPTARRDEVNEGT